MLKIKNFINKLSKLQKTTFLVLMIVTIFTLLLSISFPTLANPNASINVGTNSWNNLRFELGTVRLDSNFTFSITTDELEPPKEVNYYISNSNVPLTQGEIDQISSWLPYTSGVEISAEGFYVIYVQIVDIDDSVTYLNSDLLILDLSNPTADVTLDDSTWSDLRDVLNNVYIDREKNITINASDNLSGIFSISYYVTDGILSTSDLNALSSESWTAYSNGILINEIGTHVVYVKVTDNCSHVTYVNTDYIILNGYTENDLVIGRNTTSYPGADPYITNKSVITLNINYSNTSSDLSGYTHNLMSNLLLPLGTKITLIDNTTDKVYKYQIPTADDNYNYNDSCNPLDLDCVKVATYPFTLFKEVGTGTTEKLFIENSYYNNGTVSEDFTIVLDLSSTNILTNYNDVVLYMELHEPSPSNINVRPTLFSTIKKFNIYSNVNSEDAKANLYLTTDYSGNEITYDSDSSTDINLTSGLNYKSINDFKITDTTFEGKEIGLSIKLVDSIGNTVNRELLRNIIFKVGNNIYNPGVDNIIRINLNSGISDVTKTLTIITCENHGNLSEGTYYLKISNYVSEDGYYSDELGSTVLSIPVVVSDSNTGITYSFGVIMNDANRIISKTSSAVKVSLNILQNGTLEDPNIRISLYKKIELTAYNQSYSIVDLADYVSDTLNMAENNIYFVSTEPVQYIEPEYLYNSFELNLIPANFENTGYKFVFDLYDGTKKIGTIEKYFIVKGE